MKIPFLRLIFPVKAGQLSVTSQLILTVLAFHICSEHFMCRRFRFININYKNSGKRWRTSAYDKPIFKE